jgi:uncharacterized protein (TIGR03437 family)
VVYPAWTSGAPPQNPNHVWRLHGPAAQGEDNWVNITAAGGRSTALDPGHPAVLPYLVEVLLEPVKRYNVDGLHLDYVRYPEDSDYGYNTAALERFNRETGRAGTPVRTDPAWQAWRRRQVTDLVRQLYLRLQLLRPSVKLSAATITWGNGPADDAAFQRLDAFTRVFQDWRGWLEEGIVDLSLPMNYFRENQYPTYLDRWSEYQKDRQYDRGLVNGLGNYLNTIEATLAQVKRVLAPSAAGNRPLGLCFYSYSAPYVGRETPDPAFYRAVGEFFGEDAAAPELRWKTRPVKGAAAGQVTVDGGPAWLADGLAVELESAAGVRRLLTGVDGFFGAAELAPGAYRARVLKSGRELAVSDARAVEAGRTAEFLLRLKAADFDALLPVLETGGRTAAAPGEMVRLPGRNLTSGYGAASAVPLPRTLGGAVVLVNGEAAPLLEVTSTAVEFQMPYSDAPAWEILVRRPGMDSARISLGSVPAVPRILEVRRADGGYLEIYAAGLGAVAPPMAAGTGGNSEEPYNRCVLEILAEFTDGVSVLRVEPLYAGLAPYRPGIYQVNVAIPETVATGQVRLKAGEALSGPAVF